jgi:hypothetical protein
MRRTLGEGSTAGSTENSVTSKTQGSLDGSNRIRRKAPAFVWATAV